MNNLELSFLDFHAVALNEHWNKLKVTVKILHTHPL